MFMKENIKLNVMNLIKDSWYLQNCGVLPSYSVSLSAVTYLWSMIFPL